MAAQGKNPLRKNFMKMLDFLSISSRIIISYYFCELCESCKYLSILFEMLLLSNPT